MPRNVAHPQKNQHGDEVHPAYGTITVTSATGWTNLFGSDARHQHFLVITINEAYRRRDLSNDWIFGNKEIIELHMTEAQWSRFVGNRGSGSGTPCTITYRQDQGHIAELPDPQPARNMFAAEVRQHMERSLATLQACISRMTHWRANKVKPNTKELDELRREMEFVQADINSNLRFVASQFDEHMEEKTHAAIQEIEATFAHQLQQLGIDRAKAQMPIELPETRREDDVQAL